MSKISKIVGKFAPPKGWTSLLTWVQAWSYLRFIARPRASSVVIDAGPESGIEDYTFRGSKADAIAKFESLKDLDIKWGFRFFDNERREIWIVNGESLKHKISEVAEH